MKKLCSFLLMFFIQSNIFAIELKIESINLYRQSTKVKIEKDKQPELFNLATVLFNSEEYVKPENIQAQVKGETLLHLAVRAYSATAEEEEPSSKKTYLECIQAQLQSSADVTRKDKHGRTAYYYANEKIRNQLKSKMSPDLIKQENEYWEAMKKNIAKPYDQFKGIAHNKKFDGYPIHYYASIGLYEYMQYYIDQKVDFNGVDRSGKTPLHYAAESDDELTLHFLLTQKDIKKEIVDGGGKTPEQAAKSSTTSLFKQTMQPFSSLPKVSYDKSLWGKSDPTSKTQPVLEFSTDIKLTNIHRFHEYKKIKSDLFTGYPLHQMIFFSRKMNPENKKERFKQKIILSKNLNARDRFGKTALHYAAATFQPELAEALIKAGADQNIKDWFGKTPSYYGPLSKDEKSRTKALSDASDTSDEEGVKLVKQGIDPFYPSKELIYSVIHMLCSNKTPLQKTLQAFIEKYPETLSTVNSKGELPLHYATFNGKTEAVKILLNHQDKFDINHNSFYEGSALDQAYNSIVGYDDPLDISKMLLDAGADPRKSTSWDFAKDKWIALDEKLKERIEVEKEQKKREKLTELKTLYDQAIAKIDAKKKTTPSKTDTPKAQPSKTDDSNKEISLLATALSSLSKALTAVKSALGSLVP